ncbi:MAG: DUF2934 domain-containing protein [Acidobacteriota bacterium]
MAKGPGGMGPSQEDIARRAYQLYAARGTGQGSALADWLEAERELLDERLEDTLFSTARRRAVRHTTAPDLASK